MRAAFLLVVMVAGYPASASASTSHAANWQTHGGRVVCGVARVRGTVLDPGTQAQLTGYWPGLQCSAAGIPKPKQGIGDPVVRLGQGQAGRAQLLDESQNELTFDSPFVELAPASTWSRAGITCAIHDESVHCANSVGDGFTISPGHVELF